MSDLRLEPVAVRINRFFWRLYEDEDAKRLAEPSILNNFGTRIYLEEIRKRKELQRLYDRSNGQFCFGEVLKLNLGRFLFQWVDAFSGVVNNLDAAGKSISRSFGSVLSGGLVNATLFVGASHLAANRAYKSEGICLFRYWVWSQLYLVAATPVAALGNSLLNRTTLSGPALLSALTPSRLLFNSAFSLAIALHNSNHTLSNILYYPLIVVSGFLFRAAQAVPNGATRENLKLNVEALRDTNFAKSQASGFMRANILAVAAFTALNIIFPITLTQAKGKDGYQKAYFDYLDGKSESD